ncbi:alanine/glycine:cation symporter family protein [Desulfuromonas thiophila]|uniref:Alanine or glycine:cation symporter, AGCS family n=1 Tax=Desulfuromonas thiophila TaxID=57664 RepID=A0A1G7A539_9BACT|nr:sodium:alanine symporter family protein [Desulfuromonas thiophila]SDE09165.1 alanine or glycine:cation symporter, AGCS family [Desulfuromonas thiophila]
MLNLQELMAQLNAFVWGPVMLALLVGTGLWLSLRLKGIQLRCLPRALRLVFGRRPAAGAGDISPFQALTTALAATIGTGNIAGVATAIYLGGPGAIFWMWLCALVGMATKYAEAVLAVHFREQLPDGTMQGGPMRYLSVGLGLPWLGLLFALMGSVAAFGIGSMVQSNSVAVALQASFQVPPLLTGLGLGLASALVILGGIHRIGRVTEKLVPLMALSYMVAALVILLKNAAAIPAALALIFSHAFAPAAASAGFAGATVAMAIRFGVARGVFSNEAGLGSAPIAHAAARTDSPVRQGLIAMTGVFFDTLIVCSLTALVILTSGLWDSGERSSALTALAFEAALPGAGALIVTLGLVVFAYSTMLGWAYYGEQCIEYVFGLRARLPYRLLFCLVIVWGALEKIGLVWDFSDAMNGAMAIPNLIGLIGLSGLVARLTRQAFASGELR